ncbi:hypothetical protein D3C86_1814600 [compost metagenome]
MTALKAPSLRGMSSGRNEARATYTQEYVLARLLFLKPLICGEDPVKSNVTVSAVFVTLTCVSTSTREKQSLSLMSNPVQIPSGILARA